MSKLSEEYLKILQDIKKHISNDKEREYVLKKIADLSSIYMDIIDRITDMSTRRMDELETKVNKVSETIGLIKKDIYEDDDYDFEIVCPYCNHEFVADVEDELKEEIECPECHNIIELDWDDGEEGCDGCCSSCGHHDTEFDEDTEFDDDEDYSEEQNNDDDDM